MQRALVYNKTETENSQITVRLRFLLALTNDKVQTRVSGKITAKVNNLQSLERSGSGTSDSRLREPGFGILCCGVKTWAIFFSLHVAPVHSAV